jgi:protoporphyrinogen oxidase
LGKKKAIIIGAGPAGLTAAYELVHKTDITPIIFEMTGDIGGISKTVNYEGNRIDIGGHRFFSKSERVMQWWFNILPLQGAPSRDDLMLGRNVSLSKETDAPDPERTDRVMLIRRRLSRIFFMRQFFNYPVSLNFGTFSQLGLSRVVKIIMSYMKVRFFPIKNETSLEDFFVNRFGRELYFTFFKDYTEKVWGVPCNKIRPEWGAQRIKGLSVTKALLHAIRNIISKDSSIQQKNTETSLLEQFLYPKFGPGQMWEEVARIVKDRGGEIYLRHRVIGLKLQNDRIIEIQVRDETTTDFKTQKGDYFFSTMPVKELIESFDGNVPQHVKQVAQGLLYRDFITVGLLLKKLRIKNDTNIRTIHNIIPDNWIYIQERDVKLARLQIFNNWSPYMVKDENTTWIALEYICNEGDELWSKSDNDLSTFAIDELAAIGFVDREDVLDCIVIKMPKTYPAYFGSYDRFHVIRNFTDEIKNLFLIGRNGMHRYNNQDHSMLTAMVAVQNIMDNVLSKDNIWNVNIEKEYHEEIKVKDSRI